MPNLNATVLWWCWPGSNQLWFVTTGVNRIKIDGSGNTEVTGALAVTGITTATGGLLVGTSAFGGNATYQKLQVGNTLSANSSAAAQIDGLLRTSYIITHSGNTAAIFPNVNGEGTCGSSAARWSTVYGQAGNFSGALTGTSATFSGLLSLGGTGSLGSVTTNQKILANFDGGYSTNNSAQNKVIGFIGTTVSANDIFSSTYQTGETIKNFYLGLSTGNSYFNAAKFVIVQGGVERFNMAQGGNSTFSGTLTWSGGGSANANTAYGWGNHGIQSYATQSYVGTQIANLVASAPTTLDTLNELAAALGDDANYAATTATAIGTKLNITGVAADSQKLDGLDGLAYLHRPSGTGYYQVNTWLDFAPSSTGLYWSTGTGAGWHIYPASTSAMRIRSGSASAGSLYCQTQGDLRGQLYWTSSNEIGFLSNSGSWRLKCPSSGNLMRDGSYAIWDQGNDGSGSGLDADLLDGQHGSYYLPVSGGTMTGKLNLHTTGNPYEGSLTFGSNTTWRCGIRQHDDGDAELRIWAKSSSGMIVLATGYDGEPASIARPTDGLFVIANNVGIGNFSAADPAYKLDVKGTGNFTGALTGTTATFSGNAAIGTTLPTSNVHPQFFVGTGAILLGSTAGAMNLGSNLYYNSGWKLRADGSGALMAMEKAGVTTFYTAASGLAGSTASLTSRLQISAAGDTTLTGALTGTSATFSGIVTTGAGTGQALSIIDSSAASFAGLRFYTAGAQRWALQKSGAEGGLNAGGDLNVYRYTDAGGYLGNPLTINRASGLVTANTGLAVTGTGSFSGTLTWSGGGSANANTAYSRTYIPTEGSYVWTHSALASTYSPVGIRTSFVRAADGWQDYGAVLHVGARGSTDAGGDFQLYMGHGTSNGGTHLQVRSADNNISGDAWTGWKTIWDTGNDGAGSGLDADLLDGVDSLSFVRSDANDTLSGQYTFTKVNDHAIRVGTIRGTVVGSQSGEYIHMYNRVHIGSPVGWGSRGAPTYGLSTYGGADLATDTGSVTISGSTAWHAGNDGAGSGLDADLLDGQQATAFMGQYGMPVNNDVYMNFRVIRNQNTSSVNDGMFIGYGNTNSGRTRIYGGGSTGVHLAINAANMQFNNNTVWHAGNDGAGSGLDADLLDGLQLSQLDTRYHLASVSFLGLTAKAADSDKLDGYNYSDFLFTSGTAAEAYHLDIADTRTAEIAPNGYDGHRMSLDFSDDITSGWHSGITMKGWSTGYASWQLWGGSTTSTHENLYFRSGIGSTWNSLRTVWHSGNDGAGSGLDADLLDGQQGSYYLSTTGKAADSDLFDGNDSTKFVFGVHGYGTTNAGFASLTNAKSGFFDTSGSGAPTATWYSLVNMAHYGSNHAHQIAGSFYGHHLYHRYNNNTSLSSWSKIWSSLCDGSGSGLDADLLDGIHAASFIRLDSSATQVQTAQTVLRSHSNAWAGGLALLSADQSDKFQIHPDDNGYMYVDKNWYFTGDVHIGAIGQKAWHQANDGAGSGLDADLLDGIDSTFFNRGVSQYGMMAGASGWDMNTLFTGSSSNRAGFFDVWSGSNFPSGTTHVHGMQVRHNHANHYGWQLAGQYSQNGKLFVRGVSNNSWGAWCEMWSSGNDGAGSGLDADLLDGQQGSYYAATTGTVNQSHYVSGSAFSTNGPDSVLEYAQAYGVTDTKIAPTNDWYNSIRLGHGDPYSYYSNTIACKMTGGSEGTLYTQAILNGTAGGWKKHWNDSNDGSGSGLDADTVDGVQASYLLQGSNASGTQDNNLTDWNSPTKTGFYSCANASNRWSGQANWTSILHFKLYNSSNNYASQIGFNTYGDGLFTRTNSGNTWTSWKKIWDEHSDGAGSGLDADLLDSNHGSYYYSTTGMSATRNIVSGTDLDSDLNSGGAFGSYGSAGTSWNAPFSYGGVLGWEFSAGIKGQIGFDIRHTATDYSNFYFRGKNSTGWLPWAKAWHNLNDGAGSGLDADLIDGLHLSQLDSRYLSASTGWQNASNLNSGTVAPTRLGSGTANSSTYLRGDGTWAAVSGGGSGDITGVTAGTGLTGGGSTGSVTLAITDTAVTASSYKNSSITVNQQGQITSASSGRFLRTVQWNHVQTNVSYSGNVCTLTHSLGSSFVHVSMVDVTGFGSNAGANGYVDIDYLAHVKVVDSNNISFEFDTSSPPSYGNSFNVTVRM